MGAQTYLRQLRQGFTIVELLIVIVVIGILATIVIVAFNGIQGRAKNTSIENTASNYRRALESYAALYGQYPTPGVSACLAPTDAYPADASTADDDCYNAAVSTTMATELKKVLTNLPTPDTTCYPMYTGCRRNLTYFYSNTWKVDTNLHAHYLIYFLGNNGKCSLPDNLEGSYGDFSSADTRDYMERHSNTSMCIVKLPNP